MIKHFARLVTEDELSDQLAQQVVDAISSVVESKTVWTITDDGRQEVDFVVYQDDDDGAWVYEVVLEADVDEGEGDRISGLIEEILDQDFDFEISTDVGGDC
jgi:hypothetical protein